MLLEPAVPGTGSLPQVAKASPRSLRIAHVVDAPLTAAGANGVAEAVRCLAAAQAARGATVAVCSGVDGVQICGRSCAFEPAQLERTVLAWRPDLLHFHSVHVPQHVWLARRARRAGIPYCVTPHGGLFPPALQRGRVKKLIFRLLLERRFLDGAAFVHAVSPHEVEPVRQYGFRGPILVAANGVPPGEPADRCGETADAIGASGRAVWTFMFIGRLDSWQKGLDLLIEGFARAALPDAMLALVGPDVRGSRRALEKRAERLRVLSRVTFTGAAFGRERTRLLASADVFVHPSRWEGMSLSVLAAARAGKPCLLTPAADPLGNLGRSGAAVIVEPTASGIADGLGRFASLAPSALAAMGTRAREVADTHTSWTATAERLIGAYRNVVSAATHHVQVPGW